MSFTVQHLAVHEYHKENIYEVAKSLPVVSLQHRHQYVASKELTDCFICRRDAALLDSVFKFDTVE